MQIVDQHAVVVGGASGLGEATARRLSAEGARLSILDIATDRGEAIANELDNAQFIHCDVSSYSAVDSAFEQAVAEFDRPRVVVCCAGVATAEKLLRRGQQHDPELFAKTININVLGTFHVIRAAIPYMVEHEPIDGERGVIINTASIAAYDGQIGQVAYAASKGAIAALTLPAARELAEEQIRVCTIAPGIFDTAMLAGLPQPAREALATQVPHPQRLGRPEEYAQLATHIVENTMLNGEVIRLDGALRMPPR